jgi:penicillin-binding protein 1A
MRSAHQGVAVASLPNSQYGGGATLAQIASQITAPTPPAAMQAGPLGRPSRVPVRPEPATGLDGWLMDRLFGGNR